MFSLRKINELRGYRFYQDFKWDESNCKLFEKNNIIYGWNGSGKTTICDFFKDLENGALSENCATCKLMFRDSGNNKDVTITQKDLPSAPYHFKVFHQHYIQENISRANIRHIFNVGKEQTKKVAQLQQLQAEAETQSGVVKQCADERDRLSRDCDRFKSDKAREIKNAACYKKAYDKNRYYAAHQALTAPKILSESEYLATTAAIRTEPRPELTVPTYSLLQPTVREYIRAILEQTPVNNTIDALQRDARLSNWVEQGLAMHGVDDPTVCKFCGSIISSDRLEELRSHFNKSYKELSDKIDRSIAQLSERMDQFRCAKHDLPHYALLYPEFQEQYQQHADAAAELCKQYMAVIQDMIVILKQKKENMISDSLTQAFIELVNRLSFDYSVFDHITCILEAHNKKTQEFQQSIKQAQRDIEMHLVSVNADGMNELETKLADGKKHHDAAMQRLSVLNAEILQLEREIKDSQIPADRINQDITFIMGRSELVFQNSDLGYRIERNGKPAQHLSKGEENAVALIYFFNALQDMNVNESDTIIVLDDPISSFDANFYYNAISYIKAKTADVGQMFVFTHKFSLVKDFTMMFKENTNRYTIHRTHRGPRIINEDSLINLYHDEYAFLFKKIYHFVKEPPKDAGEFLQYPNMARRVLEGFLTFKVPSAITLMEKVKKLEQDRPSAPGYSVLRLLNNHSHLRIISSNDLADDIDSIASLPGQLENLMEFIKFHDTQHYNTLASLCDPEYDPKGKAVKSNRKTVKVFALTASSKPEDFGEDKPFLNTMEVNNPDCSFVLKVADRSMEPEISAEEIIMVKCGHDVPMARFRIQWYQGKCYFRKLISKGENSMLVARKKGCPPVVLDHANAYQILGEAVSDEPHGILK